MSVAALRTERLGKRYRTGTMRASYGRLSESLSNAARSAVRRKRAARVPASHIWALRDVSIDVEQGEVVGIIGRNGAGKTTLLKILAGITEPTEGRAGINGRVGSLLEVGTGFHPELTGRENIMLNGAILGMRRRDILRKFDDIVEFAETGAFLDTPVKRYSSGMYVRLAFAVAAHLEPEVLIVDEVLAVGDIGFQKKCLGRMRTVASQGSTVLLVSHNMQAISTLAQRALLLSGGALVADGPVSEIIGRYHALIDSASGSAMVDLSESLRTGGDRAIELTRVGLSDAEGNAATHFKPGDPLKITLGFRAKTRTDIFEIGYSVVTPEGVVLFTSSSSDGGRLLEIEPGEYEVKTDLNPNYLEPGQYYLQLGITAGTLRDLVRDAVRFVITAADRRRKSPLTALPGAMYFEFEWAAPQKAEDGQRAVD
jgi:lipopolysaccharide transport system ATP-binding protein